MAVKAIPVQAEADGDFCAASEYMHLNPVRAGLLDRRQPELLDYRWSSYPRFVGEAGLPDWLRRERVFGALELPDEGAGSRQRYRGWLAARTREVLEQEATAAEAGKWRELRRGAGVPPPPERGGGRTMKGRPRDCWRGAWKGWG